MAGASNEKVVREIFDLIVRGETENVPQFFSQNWVNHDPSLPPMRGLEGAKQLIDLWRGLSNKRYTFEEIASEGERVAVYFVLGGTHTAELMGIAPTGKTVNVTGCGIFRIVNGKATDNWVNFDALGLLQQLGVIPQHQPKTENMT